MLLDVLREKRCFKLVCGAGNEDTVEVEKLVTLYSKAGCTLFDLCAKPEIVDAAKRGLVRAGIDKDRYLCVSVGISGDPHLSKAFIDDSKCIHCGLCKKVCLQDSLIDEHSFYRVNKTRCIGCGRCAKECPEHCIAMTFELKDYRDVLPAVIQKGIDCIEFHALVENDDEVFQKWDDINALYDGPLSICIDRSKLGNERLIGRISRMIEHRKPFTTIIQADGAPMSGGKDDYKTTLQTVATAEIFQNENLPVYILLSGGTNSKSAELAKQCGIAANGVAIGSFARKIVREYIDRDDFLENQEAFGKALEIAKRLVNGTLENLQE